MIYVEHHEQEQFPSGKLKWNIGAGWPEQPQVLFSIDAQIRNARQDDIVDVWDVTTFVDTAEKLESLQLQIANEDNTSGRKVFVDHVYAVVQWDWLVMSNLVRYRMGPYR